MCNYSDMLAQIKRQPALERLSKLYGLRNGELVGEFTVKDLPQVQLVATMIGRDLDFPVGYLYSSPVERCIQTATEIAKGKGIENPVIEKVREFAHLEGLGHAQNDLGIGWYEFYYGLQRNIPELTGGITLKEAATPIIDKVFEVPETDKALDVICSHDSHVVTLASALFNFKTGINGEKV